MKKVISLFMSFVLICSLCVSASAEEVDQFTEIYPENISEGVRVFKNFDTNEMYATLDSVEFKENEEIILYVDPETGYSISVTMEDYESQKLTRDTGTSSWSAGYIPDGTVSYTASIAGAFFEASYKTNVSAYPVKMNYTHAEYIHHTGITVNSCDSKVYAPNATVSSPARSGMNFNATFTQLGAVLYTIVGYLELEINSIGQLRTSWSY